MVPWDSMNWLRVSLTIQVALAIYFQAIQWLPLGRWNRQCPSKDWSACGLGDQGPSVPGFEPLGVLALEGRLSPGDALYCLAFLLPCLGYWAGYRTRRRSVMWAPVVVYGGWLGLQAMGWWVPYVMGASDARASRYRAVFGESVQLLPSFGNHLPPDGLHLVLQLLLIGVIASALVGLLEGHSTTRAARQA